MFLTVIGFLVTLVAAYYCFHYTDDILRLQDRFRIRGDREYTDLAIFGVKLTGVFCLILSALFVYGFFKILSVT